MSRFKNEIAHLQAHIKTLRLGAGALVIVALVMGGGWWSAPRDSDHPRPARPALWQYPQVVGSAARIGLCVHVLRVPDAEPLADQWRRRLLAQPPYALAVPHPVLPGLPAGGL